MYDLDGNLPALRSLGEGGTSDGRWTNTWDGENRLISMGTLASVVSAGIPRERLEFAYDSQCRRIRKTALSGFTNGTFSITNTTAYLYDGNGNVMALVDAADKSIVASYEYDPFGNTLRATEAKASANPFRFSMKYADGETGLVYYGYRYYAPAVGRWVSRDPAEELGGLGLYVFAHNSATIRVDLFGLDDIIVFIFCPDDQTKQDETYKHYLPLAREMQQYASQQLKGCCGKVKILAQAECTADRLVDAKDGEFQGQRVSAICALLKCAGVGHPTGPTSGGKDRRTSDQKIGTVTYHFAPDMGRCQGVYRVEEVFANPKVPIYLGGCYPDLARDILCARMGCGCAAGGRVGIQPVLPPPGREWPPLPPYRSQKAMDSVAAMKEKIMSLIQEAKQACAQCGGAKP